LEARGYGLANLEHQTPATADTVYQTASVGKQFTAALVLMLSERRLLSLDERAGPHFGVDTWKEVTVRHLLTHTSGISDEGYSRLNIRLDYSDEELVSAIAAAPLLAEPGGVWSYSNSGYILLGILIGKMTGRFYGELLQDWIFAPLGMNTARVISEADIIPNRAAGYYLEGDALKNQEYVSASLNRTADGGLYCSVLDLAKWDRALYAGDLILPASRQSMWTAARLNDGRVCDYGFGWSIATTAEGRLVEHDGGWQGFSSHFVRNLDNGFSVAVLSNLAWAPVSDLAHAIAQEAAET
jgi:CubicO group peptidase (beta-lactamase class C family)